MRIGKLKTSTVFFDWQSVKKHLSSRYVLCEKRKAWLISSQMQGRRTKTRRPCWQTALWTVKARINITTSECCQYTTHHQCLTGCQRNTHLYRHIVDINELEGSPNFPIHLQSSPVTSSYLLFKVSPPFSLEKRWEWLNIHHLFFNVAFYP